MSGYKETKENHIFAVWEAEMFGKENKSQNWIHGEITSRLNREADDETSDSINGQALFK